MEALALSGEAALCLLGLTDVRPGQCNLLLTGLEAALVDAGRALDAAGVAGLEAANSARLPGLLAGWAAKPVPSWPHRSGNCSYHVVRSFFNGFSSVVLAVPA